MGEVNNGAVKARSFLKKKKEPAPVISESGSTGI